MAKVSMEYKKFIELTKNRNPWIIVYPRISISSPIYKVKVFTRTL